MTTYAAAATTAKVYVLAGLEVEPRLDTPCVRGRAQCNDKRHE
jgi:hypothetical protein